MVLPHITPLKTSSCLLSRQQACKASCGLFLILCFNSSQRLTINVRVRVWQDLSASHLHND